jgi:hypothetical protein
MFVRYISAAAIAVAMSALPALAENALLKSPPPAPFAQVSTLVPLPDFLPGLGTLYVDPATLPAGPFLGYDHDGNLAATIYMTPIEALQGGTSYEGLAVGDPTVTSVDIYYNAGHPGVESPHVHVVLFHSADAKERLAK